MANTANYNWETPDDTDLVKDGAAAIRTLGSAIDTTVFNNASAAIAKSIIDAKADLITATAADTPARLAVGTDGQYLQADSTTATGLKWATVSAGGITQLASGSFSAVTKVTLSSISGSYKHLQLIVRDLDFVTDNRNIKYRINDDSGAGYYQVAIGNENGASYTNAPGTDGIVTYKNYSGTAYENFCLLNVYDYANTSTYKTFDLRTSMFSFGSNQTSEYVSGAYQNTTNAVTSLTLNSTGGNFSGDYILYGVA